MCFKTEFKLFSATIFGQGDVTLEIEILKVEWPNLFVYIGVVRSIESSKCRLNKHEMQIF